MVKIPTKTRKSKIATPPKNVSTYKSAKKSEKPTKTKGVSKPKVTLAANKRFDVELPCSSKQAAGIGIGLGLGYGLSSSSGGGGGSSNGKSDTKASRAGSCSPTNESLHKEQQQQEQPNTALAAAAAAAAAALLNQQAITTSTTTTAALNQMSPTTPLTVNAVERYATTVDATDAEMQSKFRSGVRYSDVLRSKNVSSNGSVKPSTLINVLPVAPVHLMLGPSTPTTSNNNEVKDIDLTLFPELGQQQHRNCPSSNNGSTSVRLLQRTQTTADEDSTQATLERLQPGYRGHENSSCSSSISGGGGSSQNSQNNSVDSNNVGIGNNMNENHHQNDANNNEQSTTNNSNNNNNNNNNNANNNNSSACPQCTLNSLWVQHALFNSAQPYHMEIPEFNFLRADQNYPRFLGQFEDENYLKTENLALLGLKLALGGNFHSMHSNNGR